MWLLFSNMDLIPVTHYFQMQNHRFLQHIQTLAGHTINTISTVCISCASFEEIPSKGSWDIAFMSMGNISDQWNIRCYCKILQCYSEVDLLGMKSNSFFFIIMLNNCLKFQYNEKVNSWSVTLTETLTSALFLQVLGNNWSKVEENPPSCFTACCVFHKNGTDGQRT